MTKDAFHLSSIASSPLYNFIASPRVRLALLCGNNLDILLFSVGLGLTRKHIPYDSDYFDFGLYNSFPETLAVGLMFMPFAWLVFLLVWHQSKRSAIHPGYYVGFDLDIAVSIIIALTMTMPFSAIFLQDDRESCRHRSQPGEVPSYSDCMQHVRSIENLNTVAYGVAFLVAQASFLFLPRSR
ncbi:MAG: hypothetical protein Q9208_005869 [Pyrenodesmia sp. 3 TL-2023]